MHITKELYGKMDDRDIYLFTLKNANGLQLGIINYGGIIVSILTPDRNGNTADITLGYDNLESYLLNKPFFGAIIGRHANRLEGSSFNIDGTLYTLNPNEGNNQLHGGLKGFDKVIWNAEAVDRDGKQSLKLTYKSPDGEEHYPGNLNVSVTYSLSEENELIIDYTAVSDKDTVVNLTNHAYFNLSGHNSGSIYSHELKLHASLYTPVSEACLPTGEIWSVSGSPMDFTAFKKIGDGLLNSMDDQQMKNGMGYDHNWVLTAQGNEPKKAAELYEKESGRFMEVYTTKPGIQFYSGNHLNSAGKGKEGVTYKKHDGLCLETQFFPNAMKHRHFPSPILRAGQLYHHTTIYKFSVR